MLKKNFAEQSFLKMKIKKDDRKLKSEEKMGNTAAKLGNNVLIMLMGYHVNLVDNEGNILAIAESVTENVERTQNIVSLLSTRLKILLDKKLEIPNEINDTIWCSLEVRNIPILQIQKMTNIERLEKFIEDLSLCNPEITKYHCILAATFLGAYSVRMGDFVMKLGPRIKI